MIVRTGRFDDEVLRARLHVKDARVDQSPRHVGHQLDLVAELRAHEVALSSRQFSGGPIRRHEAPA